MPEWHQVDSSSTMPEQQESAKKKSLKSSSWSIYFPTRLYYMIYFSNSSEIGFDFYNKFYMKKSDIKNLKFLFSFHGPFIKQIWGSPRYFFSGRAKFKPSPTDSMHSSV